ncbi:MFS transporter [Notoacmeibacter sp. MSK16QG-6]|uniref:MFS transporter n=1 Tax=Notoacmeibacter sp. MSK16QG-6 TaxID=2957982 RepID=UPI00209C8EA9|nr:MFS transporter [Notoacmeibacter sp. MSK16QG-6]MCP1198028.1 MFS transporter [Notoacmeibacter sp. MSK16QG-6]
MMDGKARAKTVKSTPAEPGFPVLIVACGCIIAALTFGPRSAMGFFQLPMLADRPFDRNAFALALAIQNIFWGLGQPLFGAIADRYGTWRVLTVSGLTYAAGLVLMATAQTAGLLYIGAGILIGLGVAAGSFGIVLAAFARNVTEDQRSLVFGIGTAAGSAGMLIFAPLSQQLIEMFGWSDALFWMAAMMLVIPFLAIPLNGTSSTGRMVPVANDQTIGEALREAFGHPSYLLLTSGFFVCGFQVAFITAHFPAYLADISVDASYAVLGLALIGFCNIIGSLASGIIGQRKSKPVMLALIYIGRSIAVTAFLLLPQTPATVIAFSVAMGFLWLSTVPPTNALVAVMFGTKYLGMLGGIVFLSHQVGSFLGVWLGGYLRQTMGSYDPVWWIGVVLGLIAAILHWPISEQRVERPVTAPAE